MATTSAGFIRLCGLCVGEVVRRSPGLLVARGGHGKPVWFSSDDLVVERELDILVSRRGCDQTRSFNRRTTARSEHAAPHEPGRGKSMRICLAASVTIERLTECDHTVKKLAFTSVPIPPDRRSAITGSIS